MQGERWRRTGGTLDLSGQIDGLQWARAIAALAVVLTHAVAHPFPGAPGAFHLLGRFGVTLFFVISGLIMVLTTGPSAFDPIAFMRRRIIRIVPLYAIATLIVATLALVMPWAFKETVFSIRHTILSLLFIPAYEPGGGVRIDPVLRLGWTLNFEMFFYLTFACLFWLGAWARAICLTVFYAVLIGLGLAVDFESAILSFHTRIDSLGFVAGVWLGLYAVRRQAPMTRATFAALLLGAALNLVAMAWLYATIRDAPMTQLWLVAACVAIIACCAMHPAAFDRPLGRTMVFLGDASYAIYLFHMFAIGAVTFVALRLELSSMLAPMMGIAFVAGAGLGIVVHLLIETPIKRSLALWRDRPGSGLPTRG